MGGESSLTRAEDSWTMVGEARLKKFDLMYQAGNRVATCTGKSRKQCYGINQQAVEKVGSFEGTLESRSPARGTRFCSSGSPAPQDLEEII